MASEGYSPGPHGLEAEGFGDLVRAAVVESAASGYAAYSEYCPLDDPELQDALVEILRACGAVDAVPSKEGGDQLLVAFDGKQVYSSCNSLAHGIKITCSRVLFNLIACKGFD